MKYEMMISYFLLSYVGDYLGYYTIDGEGFSPSCLIHPANIASRVWASGWSRWAMKSSVNMGRLSMSVCHESCSGMRRTMLPIFFMKTLLPGRWYLSGSLTAWLLPSLNNFAVSIEYAPKVYVSVCTFFGFAARLTLTQPQNSAKITPLTRRALSSIHTLCRSLVIDDCLVLWARV